MPDECVDLIYLDPPFQSNHDYVAAFGDKGGVDAQLRDIWRWNIESEYAYQRMPRGPLLDAVDAIRLVSGKDSHMAAYAVFMARRLRELHRVLKRTGSIYLHCDPKANWLLRILLDKTFGEASFRNEILWCYTTPSNTLRWFPRKHDTIFFYAKGAKWTFNADDVRVPYKRGSKLDGKGWGVRSSEYSEAEVAKGKVVPNWWTDLTPVQRLVKERVGYPTQKPLALLERIINASSNEGDLVLDPFCGCGTAADAAAKLGRGYLGIDISTIAVRVMEQRLASRGGSATPSVYGLDWSEWDWEEFERMALRSRADAEDGVPGWAWAEDKVAGLLNAVPNSKKTGDGGVDARYYGAAGEVIPIQVKMHQKPVGRPDMQKLLGAQSWMQSQGIRAPMSLMVSLYPPTRNLRTFAASLGRVELQGEDYPVMQALSVEEMLTSGERPSLPPVDPRSLVGNTQTRMAMAI